MNNDIILRKRIGVIAERFGYKIIGVLCRSLDNNECWSEVYALKDKEVSFICDVKGVEQTKQKIEYFLEKRAY